jgi:4-amino-4-deoxy-L-arabinose transferase-like glycosyltransferase
MIAQKSKSGFSLFWKRYFLVISFLVFLFLRLPLIFEPLTYGDEGIYLALGQALRKGRVFYLNIHDNKPPMLYLLAALGNNFRNYRLIYLIWAEIGFFLFYFLARALFPKKRVGLSLAVFSFAILASIPLLEGTIANAENFLIYTSMGAFLILVTQKKKSWAFFLAGFLFGVSALFKIPAGVDLVAAVIVFFLLQEKNLKKALGFFLRGKFWLLVAGFLAPLLISLGYYFQKGAGPAYLRAAFGQNIPYLSSWVQDKPQAFSLPLPLILRGLAVLALVVILFLFRNKKNSSLVFKLTTVWFALTIFAALLSSRPYPHYLFQAVPAICFSVGLLFSNDKIARLLLPAFFLMILLIFVRFNYYHYPTLAYYNNFYSFALGKKNASEYLRFWGDHVEDLYQAASFIKSRTRENEEIFIWGDQPSLYPLSERLPVGRFTTAYHVKDFDKGYQETSKSLFANPPRLFVVFKNEEGSLKNLLPFLKNNYYLLKTIGEIKIYRYFKTPRVRGL